MIRFYRIENICNKHFILWCLKHSGFIYNFRLLMWILDLLYWWNFWEKFCKIYLDKADVLDALREVKMPPKMKKKGRPREQKPLLSDCRKQKSKEVLSVSPNPSQSLARWKRIGSYWNDLQIRFMLLLLLMVQDFCQLMTCLVLMRYQIQFVMKILIFIA